MSTYNDYDQPHAHNDHDQPSAHNDYDLQLLVMIMTDPDNNSNWKNMSKIWENRQLTFFLGGDRFSAGFSRFLACGYSRLRCRERPKIGSI